MRALLVIDYQNDFVDGSLGSPAAVAIGGAIRSRMEEYLSQGDDVFVTMDTHDSEYLSTLEGRMLPVEHCIIRSDGWKLHGSIADLSDRCTVLKKSTFGCGELASILKSYDEIELCGVATNICVLANAIIARTANPEARVIVRRSCVASYDERLGNEALDVMTGLQIEVEDRSKGRPLSR